MLYATDRDTYEATQAAHERSGGTHAHIRPDATEPHRPDTHDCRYPQVELLLSKPRLISGERHAIVTNRL